MPVKSQSEYDSRQNAFTIHKQKSTKGKESENKKSTKKYRDDLLKAQKESK